MLRNRLIMQYTVPANYSNLKTFQQIKHDKNLSQLIVLLKSINLQLKTSNFLFPKKTAMRGNLGIFKLWQQSTKKKVNKATILILFELTFLIFTF